LDGSIEYNVLINLVGLIDQMNMTKSIIFIKYRKVKSVKFMKTNRIDKSNHIDKINQIHIDPDTVLSS